MRSLFTPKIRKQYCNYSVNKLNHKNLEQWKHMEYIIDMVTTGAICGGVEGLLFQPLNILKMRRQYNDKLIFKPSVLYRGATANSISMAFCIATRVSVNDLLLKMLSKENSKKNSYKLACAFAGGWTSGFFTGPVEYGIIQQQFMLANKKAKNCFSIIFNSIKNLGFRAAFSGTNLACIRDGFVNSGFLFVAPILENKYCEQLQLPKSYCSLIAGVSGGITAQIISQPIDTIKTIQQANNGRYNFKECAKIIYEKSGIFGLYHGSFWRGSRVIAGISMMHTLKPIVQDTINKP